MSIVDMTGRVPVDRHVATAAPVLGYHLGGSRVPLIFVRTWFNEVDTYGNLARRLGPDQPLYTIAPPYGTTRAEMPSSAEEWSDFCRERLTAIGSSEPYVLGGWSFGGVVALELARTLHASGAEIARILMIDTWLPHHRARTRGRIASLLLHLHRLAELDPGTRRAYVEQRIAKRIRRWRKRRRRRDEPPAARDAYGVGHIVTNRGTEMSLLRRAVWVAHYKYVCAPTALPVSLYWSAISRDTKNDVSLGWIAHLRGDFESVGTAGDHFTLFEEPHVATLAERMARTVAACVPAARDAADVPRTARLRGP